MTRADVLLVVAVAALTGAFGSWDLALYIGNERVEAFCAALFGAPLSAMIAAAGLDYLRGG